MQREQQLEENIKKIRIFEWRKYQPRFLILRNWSILWVRCFNLHGRYKI